MAPKKESVKPAPGWISTAPYEHHRSTEFCDHLFGFSYFRDQLRIDLLCGIVAVVEARLRNRRLN
jgi:hypothetical protein